MLFRVFCVPCRLSTLWTDDPVGFLSDTCNHPRRCEASLSDEDFPSFHSRSTVTAASPYRSAASSGVLPFTKPDPPRAEQHVKLTP
jgi:hypothetical protein